MAEDEEIVEAAPSIVKTMAQTGQPVLQEGVVVPPSQLPNPARDIAHRNVEIGMLGNAYIATPLLVVSAVALMTLRVMAGT